jgi:PEP-CTERM motif
MKQIFLVLLTAVALILAVSTASATPLPPFSSTLVSPTALPPNTLLASVTDPFNFTGNVGSITETVNRNNGTGMLFFTFQVQVISGDIARLTTGTWNNLIVIDAAQVLGTGVVPATTADRNGFTGTLGINWGTITGVPPILAGQTSDLVVLSTNAINFTSGTLGLIDTGASGPLSGFVAVFGAPPATPEPATLSLLGFGLLGLGTLRKKLRK